VQNDPGLTCLDDVLGRAEVLFIGTPHDEYRSLDFAGRDVVDVWNLLGRGTLT
jgi:hypothetical protein